MPCIEPVQCRIASEEGDLEKYIEKYLLQVSAFGYENAPLEIDARKYEAQQLLRHQMSQLCAYMCRIILINIEIIIFSVPLKA